MNYIKTLWTHPIFCRVCVTLVSSVVLCVHFCLSFLFSWPRSSCLIKPFLSLCYLQIHLLLLCWCVLCFSDLQLYMHYTLVMLCSVITNFIWIVGNVLFIFTDLHIYFTIVVFSITATRTYTFTWNDSHLHLNFILMMIYSDKVISWSRGPLVMFRDWRFLDNILSKHSDIHFNDLRDYYF